MTLHHNNVKREDMIVHRAISIDFVCVAILDISVLYLAGFIYETPIIYTREFNPCALCQFKC